MGDWNAKVGERKEKDSVSAYGLGTSNTRGDQLVEFAQSHGLDILNTFYPKKWTWCSPDMNQIDCILSNKRELFTDVESCFDFTLGSDHQPVKAKFILKYQNRIWKKNHVKSLSTEQFRSKNFHA